MAENIPIKVFREQNISVSLWEKVHKGNILRSVTIQQTFPTKETKNLPKEQRKYTRKDITIGYDQIETVQNMLGQLRTEEKENE